MVGAGRFSRDYVTTKNIMKELSCPKRPLSSLSLNDSMHNCEWNVSQVRSNVCGVFVIVLAGRHRRNKISIGY